MGISGDIIRDLERIKCLEEEEARVTPNFLFRASGWMMLFLTDLRNKGEIVEENS